jgi:hypothetical protein
MCYYPPLPLLPAVALAKVEARANSAFFSNFPLTTHQTVLISKTVLISIE